MVKAKSSKIAVLAFAAALGVGALAGSFGPASAAADPVQATSSDTATITLGKILKASQDNKFPNIADFNFVIEPVEAWDNANVSTSDSGAMIPVAQMPMPAADATAHHTVTAAGNVSVGDFTASESGDTARQKTRTTDVDIQFNKAGYYVYKVTETAGSVQGVTYDDHEYFIVIYVANCTDQDGNTTNGVYVHDITSYRNESGSDTYKPTLSDISNTTDNGGTAASTNNEENLAKVGHNSGNSLDAYKFWNSQDTQDIEIVKNVTGNLGDVTKQFEFTLTMTGLEPGVAYTTSGNGTLVSASVGTCDTTAGTITADASGNATVLVKLSDDKNFKVEGLPVGAQYAVNEAASDHEASYAVTADGSNPTIAQASGANAADNTALATATETVNTDDGTVTVTYTNDRDLTTITGIPTYLMGGIAMALAALVALFAVRKRRNSLLDEE